MEELHVKRAQKLNQAKLLHLQIIQAQELDLALKLLIPENSLLDYWAILQEAFPEVLIPHPPIIELPVNKLQA